MRVTGGAQTRGDYFDRQPANVTQNYAAAVAPHAQTQRINTTLAAGAKALAQMFHLAIQRSTAAGVASTMTAFWAYTVSGGSLIIFGRQNAVDNTVDKLYPLDLPYAMYLAGGDNVSFYTADLSTAGTVYFEGNTKYTTFGG